jgi:uncharacterized protein (DUF2336 family)
MPESLDICREIDAAIAGASSGRRAEILGKITDLFIAHAAHCTDADIALFDDVIGHLAAEIEAAARAVLARKLAPVPNAPPRVIRALAFDDAIEVAGPVLTLSARLDNAILIETAVTKSQRHLLAISRRSSLDTEVTDVLVRRGDREVALSIASNPGARLSDTGFGILIDRAVEDDPLAESIGARPEIPPHLFLKLLTVASERVRNKLAAEHPRAGREIDKIVAEVAGRIRKHVAAPPPDYAAAKHKVDAKLRSGPLAESDLAGFVHAGQVEETTVALAVMCELPIATVERAMQDEWPDALLTIARAIGLGWPTAKAILRLRAGSRGISASEIDHCLASFERMKPETARQIIRFHRLREGRDRSRRT